MNQNLMERVILLLVQPDLEQEKRITDSLPRSDDRGSLMSGAYFRPFFDLSLSSNFFSRSSIASLMIFRVLMRA